MLASEPSRRAFAEQKGYQAVAQILLRKQEMVISGAISVINQLSLHGNMSIPAEVLPTSQDVVDDAKERLAESGT